MDSEKFEERLARLERLENRTVKRPAFEQFALRVAVALTVIGCLVAAILIVYWHWRAGANGGGSLWLIAPIAILLTFIYSFALFIVFKRVYEM